jgi:nucleoside-diphosphate-sugar epimerase
MRIAVTGANGFVGQAVCEALRAAQHTVRPILREVNSACPTAVAVGPIQADTDWTQALTSIDCVVHCAARVHVMAETEADPLAAFRSVNVEGSRRLAEQAAQAGVKRLIFLSSLKVLGEHTEPGHPFQADAEPHPEDPYGISKWEGEQAVQQVARVSGLEVVVIRPPLVYGPGVKANFLKLLNAVSRGLPLPMGAIDNRRSLVNLSNLCDLITVCVHHPAAPGEVFLVSDGEDISTPELIRAMAEALGRPAHLIPVPLMGLRLAGRLSGRQAQIERLTGSLQVEIGHTRGVLGWTPRTSLQQALQRLVQAHLK